MNPPNSPAQKNSKRTPIIVAVVALLLSAGVIGNTVLKQRQRTQQAFLTSEERTRAEVDKANLAARSSPQQKAVKIERAQLLRAKWSKWALENKGLLKEMLRARPDDRAALDRAWNALPRPGDKENAITAQDLSPDGNKVTKINFGWAPAEDLMTPQVIQRVKDPKERAMMTNGQKQSTEIREDKFKKFRDIELASSFGGGNTTVTLWASGRITQRRPQTQQERVQALTETKELGRSPHYINFQGEEQEVAPPYDFLR